jgi:hypothetical protein
MEPWPQRSKKAEKSKFFSILEIFSKVEVQKFNVCAFLTRLIKPDKKKSDALVGRA